MEVLPINAEVLKKRFPITFNRILKAKDELPFPFELDPSGICKMTIGGTLIYPYGSTQLEAEELIDAWVKSFDLKNDACNIVSGFGSGLHVKKLLEKIPSGSLLIVGEKNPELLKFIFSRLDCSEWLKNEKLFIVVDPFDDIAFKEFGGAELVFKSHVETCVYSPLFVFDESYYYRFFTQFARVFDFYKKLQSTNVGDSELWQKNAFENLPYLLNRPDVGVLKNLFADLPIILVSAGPSLDEAIPFLKEAQNYSLVISMNSSYRKLVKNGVFSHITLAADPRLSTFEGYRNQPANETFLICPFFVHPNVVTHFFPNIFTWQNANILVDQIRKQLKLPAGTAISEQGTVAACIADLAHLFGCGRVCLVGQDLAVTREGQTHTSDSFYRDRGQLFMNLSECRTVPGNTFDKVYVESKLFVYLKTFNALVKKFSNIEFINTSRLGAKIEGAPYKTYQEAIQFIGKISSRSVTQILKEKCKPIVNEIEKSKVETQKGLGAVRNFCNELLDSCLEAVMFHELFSPPCQYNDPMLQRAYRYADKVNACIDNSLDNYYVLFDGKTKRTLTEFQKNMEKLNPSEEISPKQDWVRNREYYWALAEGAHSFLVNSSKVF